MADSDRYDSSEGPDTHAKAKELVVAQDGDMEARVTIEAEGPEVQPVAVLCDALASANRSIVDRVFSGSDVSPESAGDSGAGAEDVTDEVDDGGDDNGGGRLMDYGGDE